MLIKGFSKRFRHILPALIHFVRCISWRCGRPFICSSLDLSMLKSRLQPGTIILSRRNYEFSNLMIRGYWKHAAICIDETRVAEAVFEGARIREIVDVIRGSDDFKLIRPGFGDSTVCHEASKYAERMVGVPYNVLFKPDANSLYCSELVLNAYEKAMNGKLDDTPFQRMSFRYHRGYVIEPDHFLALSM